MRAYVGLVAISKRCSTARTSYLASRRPEMEPAELNRLSESKHEGSRPVLGAGPEQVGRSLTAGQVWDRDRRPSPRPPPMGPASTRQTVLHSWLHWSINVRRRGPS